MKEAIANVGVFNIMIVFVVVLLTLFVGSLGYIKAYKVKDYIINEIETDEGWDDLTEKKVDDFLIDVGYQSDFEINCPSFDGGKAIKTNSSYKYCVYKFDLDEDNSSNKTGVYYKVIAYIKYDFPIIGQMVKIPVSGETRLLNVTIKN